MRIGVAKRRQPPQLTLSLSLWDTRPGAWTLSDRMSNTRLPWEVIITARTLMWGNGDAAAAGAANTHVAAITTGRTRRNTPRRVIDLNRAQGASRAGEVKGRRLGNWWNAAGLGVVMFLVFCQVISAALRRRWAGDGAAGSWPFAAGEPALRRMAAAAIAGS